MPSLPKPFVTPRTSTGASPLSMCFNWLLRRFKGTYKYWTPTLRHPGAVTTNPGLFLGRWLSWFGWLLMACDFLGITDKPGIPDGHGGWITASSRPGPYYGPYRQ